jgi:hypothetical protein
MPRITPTVKQILIGLFAAYVVQLILENFLGMRVFGWLAMLPGAPMPWQLLTYVLVDKSNPIFFLLTLLFIAWTLPTFDLTFGRKRTLQLALVSVLCASVPAWLAGFVFVGAPALFGASPILYGGIATVSWLDRQRPVSLFGALHMTAQQLLMLFVGLSVLFYMFDKNETRLIADLGALGGGILFANWLRKPRRPKKPPERKKARATGFKVIQGGQPDDKMLH